MPALFAELDPLEQADRSTASAANATAADVAVRGIWTPDIAVDPIGDLS